MSDVIAKAVEWVIYNEEGPVVQKEIEEKVETE
jgi:hypothetical protein